MNIALDAMGGDYAPRAVLEGVADALEGLPEGDRLYLVGKEEIIRQGLQELALTSNRIEVVDAPDIIGMNEAPTMALSRKRHASIPMGYQLMKQGVADAFISAGNTGAMLVGSIYSLHTIPGIIRPCISAMIPRSRKGHTLILDVGSNPDTKPDVLYQYGLIGAAYATLVMGVKKPKVALLNIGEEEEKGSILTQAAYRIMNGTPDYHFTGNIEARDLFTDKADVIVCDGFTGNIIVKQIEGFYNMMKEHGIHEPVIDQYNYKHHGGSPVLGVNGIAIIGHGISDGPAISKMVYEARKIHDSGLIPQLQVMLERFID